MVVLGLILLVLVAVLVLAIFVSNPDIYDLSIFGAVVKVTSAGIFITGAITMAGHHPGAPVVAHWYPARSGTAQAAQRSWKPQMAAAASRLDHAGRDLDDLDHD